MFKSNYLLFLIPALIWGSTWYVIKYQLGDVDPIVSVAYRFSAAGLVLLLFAKLRKLPLSFSKKEHAFIALQGLLLFGTNYWLVYMSELYLSSGLVAVAFSTLIFMNIFFGALLLGDKVKKVVIVGAFFGLLGTVLIYQSEFRRMELNQNQVMGLIFCMSSIVFASLGNITSAYNQRKFKLPVLQTNGFGMLYGGLSMFVIALFLGKNLAIDTSTVYLSSFGYLVVFGSVIAFTLYLTLVGRVGAGRAAYTVVVIPIIALTISTLFEGYKPDVYAYVGMVLIIGGNVLALRSKS
ncbi:MAG: EamA family transporter [Cellulophaga sp.]